MTPAEIRDATAERSTWGIAALLEYRGDRVRDRTAHHLIMPNGSLSDSFHEGFIVAAGRANMALWDEWIAARRKVGA